MYGSCTVSVQFICDQHCCKEEQNKSNSNDTIEDIKNVTVEPSQTISANHDALFSPMSSLQ